MKVGSFFLVLLVALVALGYLLSDSFHLREDVSSLQRENVQLVRTLQETEQGRQSALVNLQNASQELLSCQQSVAQSNQIITQISDENAYLREHSRQLADQVQLLNSAAEPPHPQFQPIQSNAFGRITFFVLGVGSLMWMVLKGNHKRPILKSGTAKTGQYVYLTNAEIRDLLQRRRMAM